MIFKDNLVIPENNGNLILMNMLTYRRKIVPKQFNPLLIKLCYEGADNLSEEELDFVSTLEDENQILGENGRKVFNQYIETRSSQAQNHDGVIRPNIMTTNDCDCACSYCHQKTTNTKRKKGNGMTEQHIDGIYEFYKQYAQAFGNESNYEISITDGEMSDINSYIFSKWNEAKFNIVTNGVNIDQCIKEFPLDRISKFKVSIDGLKGIHGKRSPSKAAKESFEKLVSGIDTLLKHDIDIELKVTADKNTIMDLPELFDFMENKQWLSNPKVKIGLSGEYSEEASNKLDERFNECYEIIDKLMYINQQDSRIKKTENDFLYGLGYMNYLLKRPKNKFIDPKIYRCEMLCSPDYTFDESGNVYLCSSFVGSDKGIVGTFYPEVTINKELINKLKDRNILKMEKCNGCAYKFVCLGGCPYSALTNKNDIMKCDCGYFSDENIMNNLGYVFL